MKTKFALLNDKNNIIEINEDIGKLINLKNDLNNRINGKTTRAIFQALSCEKDVHFISETRMSSECVIDSFVKLLNDLNFEFVYNKSERTIKPLYSGTISFISKDRFKSMYYKPNRNTIIIQDLF